MQERLRGLGSVMGSVMAMGKHSVLGWVLAGWVLAAQAERVAVSQVAVGQRRFAVGRFDS